MRRRSPARFLQQHKGKVVADNPLTEPERFQAWVEHPLTQAFRQYLKDYRDSMSALWVSGEAMSEGQQAQATTLHDLSLLECSDVRRFYGLEDAETGE